MNETEKVIVAAPNGAEPKTEDPKELSEQELLAQLQKAKDARAVRAVERINLILQEENCRIECYPHVTIDGKPVVPQIIAL